MFKNWTETGELKTPVTLQMKELRAEKLAEDLSEDTRWHSHGRPIDKEILENELGLEVYDLSKKPELRNNLKKYFGLVMDYMNRQQYPVFVHMKGYF